MAEAGSGLERRASADGDGGMAEAGADLDREASTDGDGGVAVGGAGLEREASAAPCGGGCVAVGGPENEAGCRHSGHIPGGNCALENGREAEGTMYVSRTGRAGPTSQLTALGRELGALIYRPLMRLFKFRRGNGDTAPCTSGGGPPGSPEADADAHAAAAESMLQLRQLPTMQDAPPSVTDPTEPAEEAPPAAAAQPFGSIDPFYFQPRKRAASQGRGRFSDDSPSSEGEGDDEGSALRRSGKKDRRQARGAAGAPRAQSRTTEATKESAGAASKPGRKKGAYPP